MASNQSNTSTCPLSETWISIGEQFGDGVADILTPIYFSFGFFGRLINLLAIYQERKSEKAYFYQIMILVSELLELIAYAAAMHFWEWASFQSPVPGPPWFTKCYFCMWYTAHIASIAEKAFTTCTLLLTLAMTLDRIFSLAKPIVYKNLKHKKIQWTILVISITFGVLINLVWGIQIDIASEKKANGAYDLQLNSLYRTPLITGWRQVEGYFKMVIALSLVISNFVLFYLHRKKMREKAKLKNQPNVKSVNDVSKTLFKMTICQSICNTVGVIAISSYSIFAYQVNPCVSNLFFSPLKDAIFELADILEFYIILAISNRFRQMVWRTIVKFIPARCKSGTTVTTIVVISRNQQTVPDSKY